MAKKEYGFFDREKVEDAVTMMLNAHAEVEYDTARKYMYYIVEGKQITLEQEVPESKHPFLKYFDANWHQCRGMLGGFGRSDVPHSGNTTNNRLEAAWGLLFDPQHKGKRLDACEDILKELFPDQVAKMTIKRETKLKQTDGSPAGAPAREGRVAWLSASSSGAVARYQVTEGCLGIGDEVRKGGVLGSKGEVRFAEGAVASEAAGEAATDYQTFKFQPSENTALAAPPYSGTTRDASLDDENMPLSQKQTYSNKRFIKSQKEEAQ
ncbi:hypothetical protein PC116_g15753 [Phytophthora cactorum]|nr:hypothetical protein PC116_g15753 [Phytophthora cactorum]